MSTAKLNSEIKKWLWYVLILLAAYVCQTTPGFLSFFGYKPVWIVPVAVAIGVFEGEVAAAAIGAVAGLMWDLSSARVAGLHGILLCVLCVACCLLCLHFIRPTLVGISALSGAVVTLVSLVDFIFTYFLFYDNTLALLATKVLPVCVLTVLCAPVTVWLCRIVHGKYSFEET